MDESILRRQLFSLAKSIVSDQSDFNVVDHVREMFSVIAAMGRDTDPYFEVFLYVESETEDVPTGPLREKVAEEFLRRMDEKLARVMSRAREDLLRKCFDIIERYAH